MATTTTNPPTDGVKTPLPETLPMDREELIATLRKELRVEYQAKLEQALETERQALRVKNDETIKKAIEDWKRQQQPPSAEEIRGLLENEVPGFDFKFKAHGREVKFRIREVPSKVERKILKTIRETLVPHAAQIASITSGLMSGGITDKVQDFFDAFEPGVKMLAEICVIILNACPEDEDEADKLSVEDVESGLSTFRQLAVLNAFIQVNRIRDFFLLAFRLMNR